MLPVSNHCARHSIIILCNSYYKLLKNFSFLKTYLTYFLKLYEFNYRKNNTEVAKIKNTVRFLAGTFHPASPNGNIYVKIVQYRNQENDIGTIPLTRLQALFGFHQFLHACTRLCVCVCFITRIDSLTSWANCSNSLSLGFLIYKIGVKILSSLGDRGENSMR